MERLDNYFGDHLVPMNYTARDWTSLDHQVFDRQRNFIRTISRRPELAKCVRDLAWTILDPNNETWHFYTEDREDESRRDELVPSKSYEPEIVRVRLKLIRLEIIMHKVEPMWDTFKRMSNVVSIDLCWVRSASSTPSSLHSINARPECGAKPQPHRISSQAQNTFV